MFWKRGEDDDARLSRASKLLSHKAGGIFGFPNSPSCMAYDRKYEIIAVGTKSGCCYLHGNRSFYVRSQLFDCPIQRIVFVPGSLLFLVLTENGSHLSVVQFSLDGENVPMTIVARFVVNERSKAISCIDVLTHMHTVLLGLENGDINFFSLQTNCLTKRYINQRMVCEKSGLEIRGDPGSVECISLNPSNESIIVIGYTRNLLVVYDIVDDEVYSAATYSKHLESLSWNTYGTRLISSHEDGSVSVWSWDGSNLTSEFGPSCLSDDACLPLPKARLALSGSEFFILNGGLSKDYTGRFCMTINEEFSLEGAVVNEFGSKIVDFVCLPWTDARAACVIVLCEEELVIVDLSKKSLPIIPSCHLTPPHASTITAIDSITNLSPSFGGFLYRLRSPPEKLYSIVGIQTPSFSGAMWPLEGGQFVKGESLTGITLTGHESGTVYLWRTYVSHWEPLIRIDTMLIFEMDPSCVDEEDIPIRRVGVFDPLSDDPRFRIQRLQMQETEDGADLAVAGMAGQIIVYHFGTGQSARESTSTVRNSSSTLQGPGSPAGNTDGRRLGVVKVDVTGSHQGFTWKGQDPLRLLSRDAWPVSEDLTPISITQLHPPASVTALRINPATGIIMAGTAHGIAVVDYLNNVPIFSHCTLLHGVHTGVEGVISRAQSFKKSLRQSFRRLRKTKRRGPGQALDTSMVDHEGGGGPAITRLGGGGAQQQGWDTAGEERQIQAREHNEDIQPARVRCVSVAPAGSTAPNEYFAFAGTEGGKVYSFRLERKTASDWGWHLATQIQLAHQAPVLNIFAVDRHHISVESSGEPDKLVIVSEEQVKVLSWKHEKSFKKIKITAKEGSRIRKAVLIDPIHEESAGPLADSNGSKASIANQNGVTGLLAILTNQGEVVVYSIPHLKRGVLFEMVSRGDVLGLTNCVLSSNGDLTRMVSPSQVTWSTIVRQRGEGVSGRRLMQTSIS